ncbi:MAG: cryptochrome/photolyase family protein, partial [Planctomycetota bacterium]
HETTHVPCHKQRVTFFLSAMRHFRDGQRAEGREVIYHELTADRRKDRGKTFGDVLRKTIKSEKPARVRVVEPGDERVRTEIASVCDDAGVELDVLRDTHFYCSIEEFRDWAGGKKVLILETFYRMMRKREGVLMADAKNPVDDRWNFDEDNRETFGKTGPDEEIKGPMSFSADDVTQGVLDLVEDRWGDHPGSLEKFALPVTRGDARKMLRYFIKTALPRFGTYEDAMWTGEAFVYHSRLSALLNIKLLNPRECVAAAIEAYEKGHATIANVEGFVRQLIGWREFIRGVYWLKMPEYAERNALAANRQMPSFFWDGETDMACVKHAMSHVIDHGYTHHIERLMVLGNLAMMYGADPYAFHEWHMAMYVDAIDWVSLPNTLGMSQYGDGGVVGTKPYCSTGKYVDRMSNYCKGCRYKPGKAVGDDACPFTTLYWDFLARNETKLKGNNRMALQLKNVVRKREKGELGEIRDQADTLRLSWAATPSAW